MNSSRIGHVVNPPFHGIHVSFAGVQHLHTFSTISNTVLECEFYLSDYRQLSFTYVLSHAESGEENPTVIRIRELPVAELAALLPISAPAAFYESKCTCHIAAQL